MGRSAEGGLPVGVLALALSYIPSPNGSCMPPSEALGWDLVNVVVITLSFYHNNCVFNENSSSPADYFASCSSIPSGGGKLCCFPSRGVSVEAALPRGDGCCSS